MSFAGSATTVNRSAATGGWKGKPAIASPSIHASGGKPAAVAVPVAAGKHDDFFKDS